MGLNDITVHRVWYGMSNGYNVRCMVFSIWELKRHNCSTYVLNTVVCNQFCETDCRQTNFKYTKKKHYLGRGCILTHKVQ